MNLVWFLTHSKCYLQLIFITVISIRDTKMNKTESVSSKNLPSNGEQKEK